MELAVFIYFFSLDFFFFNFCIFQFCFVFIFRFNTFLHLSFICWYFCFLGNRTACIWQILFFSTIRRFYKFCLRFSMRWLCALWGSSACAADASSWVQLTVDFCFSTFASSSGREAEQQRQCGRATAAAASASEQILSASVCVCACVRVQERQTEQESESTICYVVGLRVCVCVCHQYTNNSVLAHSRTATYNRVHRVSVK